MFISESGICVQYTCTHRMFLVILSAAENRCFRVLALRGAPTSLFVNPPLYPNWHPPRSVRPTTATRERAFALVAPGNRAGNATVLVARRSAPFMSRFSSGYATHSRWGDARRGDAPRRHCTPSLYCAWTEREREREREIQGENLDNLPSTICSYDKRSFFLPDVTPPITFVSITLQMRRCSRILFLWKHK